MDISTFISKIILYSNLHICIVHKCKISYIRHKFCTYVAIAHLTPGMTWKHVERSIERQGMGWGVGMPPTTFWMTMEKVLPRVYGRHRHTFDHLQGCNTTLQAGVVQWFLCLFPYGAMLFLAPTTALSQRHVRLDVESSASGNLLVDR